VVKSVEIKRAYQCSYCDKQYVNYKSAWGHEHRYCKSTESPHIKNCDHEYTTQYVDMGAGISEPDYGFCIKCGVTEMDFHPILIQSINPKERSS